MREPNFNCLGATSQVPTLIEELYAHRNALSSYEQTPRRWKRMEGKRPACGGNLVTWHPGELHLTREDVRKPPALQKDMGFPRSTVQNRRARALARLADILTEGGDPHGKDKD